MRSAVRATMMPPHRRNPADRPVSASSRSYRPVEYCTSRVPLSVARSWPTRPAACQVVPQDSWPCSRSSTSLQPASVRWYATLAPITPPPMITTWARLGSSLAGPVIAGSVIAGSVVTALVITALVITGRLVQQPREARRGHPRGGAFPAFHRPRPEVEVDRADRVLDRAPQRPAVHPGQAQQPGTGDLVPHRAAVVGGDQLGQAVGGQAAFPGYVAELEAGVVVAGVLVVDQPDLLAVVDEVGRQEVVVARHGALVAHGQGRPHGLEPRAQIVVAVRDAHARV